MNFDHRYISNKDWKIEDIDHFIIDLSKFTFFEPIGLIYLASKIRKQFERSGTGKIIINENAINYLERINFLEYLENAFGCQLEMNPERPSISRNPLFDQLLEFKEIEFKDRYDYEECIDHLSQLCQTKIGNSISYSYINDVFSELMSNVARHSKQLSFFAVAQKYPSLGIIKISIGDNGIGIPQSLKSKGDYVNMNDIELIHLSTLSEISADGGGMGLTTLKSYMEERKEYLVIFSNSGYVKYFNGGYYEKSSFKSEIFGTFVEICLQMDSKKRQVPLDNDLLF